MIWVRTTVLCMIIETLFFITAKSSNELTGDSLVGTVRADITRPE